MTTTLNLNKLNDQMSKQIRICPHITHGTRISVYIDSIAAFYMALYADEDGGLHEESQRLDSGFVYVIPMGFLCARRVSE